MSTVYLISVLRSCYIPCIVLTFECVLSILKRQLFGLSKKLCNFLCEVLEKLRQETPRYTTDGDAKEEGAGGQRRRHLVHQRQACEHTRRDCITSLFVRYNKRVVG